MHQSTPNGTPAGDRARRAEVPIAGPPRCDTRSRDWLAAWRRSLLRPELVVAAATALLLSSWIGAYAFRDLALREAWFSLTILCVALPWLGYALVQLGLLTVVALGLVRVGVRTVPRGGVVGSCAAGEGRAGSRVRRGDGSAKESRDRSGCTQPGFFVTR